MKVLLVEDEPLAAERLALLIAQYDSSIEIIGSLQSIDETVQWLRTRPHPDLLFLDIQLSDGHSFEIFNQVKINKPVIFTTAYDNYAIDAFRHFSIDYILKPVTLESLAAAIEKFKSIPQLFHAPDYTAWSEQLKENIAAPKYKDRFLAKVGQRTFFLQVDDIAYFYADDKTIYLVDPGGNKFIINYNMDKLESVLDPHHFFRINRKIIVHSKMIELIKPYINNRLKLILKNVKPEEEFIVSRERVPAFKSWAEG